MRQALAHQKHFHRSTRDSSVALHRIAVREHFICVDNFCTIQYIADSLGHMDLRDRMLTDRVLRLDGLPDQRYLDSGYLTIVMDDDGVSPLVLVTPWGTSWLLRRYGMTDAAGERSTRPERSHGLMDAGLL